MKVLQILPELIQGGVERGTLDLGRELVKRGHESHVISNGGPLVKKLEQEGSVHHQMPVHLKRLSSLRQVRPLRRKIMEIAPDIVHVRSRLPAWLNRFAYRKIPTEKRPALISTVHGMYSVNFYSAIMTRADRVIAISSAVQDYITQNYPKVDPTIIRLIHRAVDREEFPAGYQSAQAWRDAFFRDFPQLADKKLLLFPGRITRWKGHKFLLDLMEKLKDSHPGLHAVIVGEAHATKSEFLDELTSEIRNRGLDAVISFLGRRSDMKDIYAVSSLAFNLSDEPEPFGRTVIEALAVGLPVVAWDQGGPAEVLRACYPQGLVPYPDQDHLLQVVAQVISSPGEVRLAQDFMLDTLVEKTLDVYREAIGLSGA